MPKEDREDALTFYSEYLEDYGFAENEDVTAKIGTPKEVAKNMIAEITMKHIDSNEEKKSAKKTAVIVWIAIISIFSLPISLPIALCLLIIVFALFITLLILFIALVGAGLSIFIRHNCSGHRTETRMLRRRHAGNSHRHVIMLLNGNCLHSPYQTCGSDY